MKQYALARPYAKAAFSFAKEQNNLAAWTHFLNKMAALARDPVIAPLLKHPEAAEILINSVQEQHKKKESMAFTNFLKLLHEKHRLMLLPEIAELFNQDVQSADTVRNCLVKSALPLLKTEMKTLEKELQERFGQPVELRFEVDTDLIGGLVIESGDYVIDGSLKGQLQRLKTNLTL